MIIKVNAPIILLRNINTRNGHCNGTRYIVQSATNRLLTARMIGGEYDGSILLIPRMIMSPSDSDLPFRLIRRQFPVRPAFAMTINKSQGQNKHFTNAASYLNITISLTVSSTLQLVELAIHANFVCA